METGTVTLWDAAKGKVRATFKGHTHTVTSLAFSSDGRLLASGSPAEARLWDVSASKEIANFAGANRLVALSGDGSLLATGFGARVRLWNVGAGRVMATLKGHDVRSVAFSDDGAWLANSGDGVTLWDVATIKEKAQLEWYPDSVRCLAFAGNGSLLALNRWNGTIWDVTTNREVATALGAVIPIDAAAFSANGELLATASNTGTIQPSPDGRLLATGFSTVLVWDVATGKEAARLETANDWVTCVSFSGDAKMLALGSNEDVRLWDIPKALHKPESARADQVKGGKASAISAVPPKPSQFNRAARRAMTQGPRLTPRSQSESQLRQLARAMHDYHDAVGNFPPAFATGKDGSPLYSWRVLILPYLDSVEAQNLHRQFKLDEPWDSPTNKPLLARMPGEFAAPGPESSSTHYQVIVGRGSLFKADQRFPVCMSQISDGPSNTLMIVEAAEAVPWSKPADLRFDSEGRLPKFGGVVEGGFNAAFADGRVYFIPEATSAQKLRAWITYASHDFVESPAGAPAWRPPEKDGGDKLGPLEKTPGLPAAPAGVQVNPKSPSTAGVRAVLFAGDGKTLLTLGSDSSQLWDVHTAKRVRAYDQFPPHRVGKTPTVPTFAISPDGSLAAVGSQDQSGIVLLEVATGKELRRLKGLDAKELGNVAEIHRLNDRRTDDSPDVPMSFSPDGKLLARGGVPGGVRLWDTATGTELHQLRWEDADNTSLAFSANGKLLAAGSNHGRISLWDVATGKSVRILGQPQGFEIVFTLAFSGDGKFLASCHSYGFMTSRQNQRFRLWDIAAGKELFEFPRGESVAFSPSGTLMASWGPDGRNFALPPVPDKTLRIWETATGKERPLEGHWDVITSAAFSPDGKILASASLDQTIRFWNVDSGKQRSMHRLQTGTTGFPRAIRCLAWSPDSKVLAWGPGDDEKIHLCDPSTGKELGKFE
jgi:WD40 repeat protein